MQLKIIRFAILLLERLTAHFISSNFRPKIISKRILNANFESYGKYESDWCILIQGPIITKFDFTLNTIILYRHIYPNARIILSTWVNEKGKIQEKILKGLRVNVLFNKKPDYSGISNINLQLVSTNAGLNFASDSGSIYVLKTRTDQRVCKSIDFLGHMHNLQINFPIKSNSIENRLIVSSINSFKSRLYGITDMFMFGNISDMKLFWQVPNECINNSDTHLNQDPVYFISNKQAEGYLVTHFFNSSGFSPTWSSKDSQLFLSTYFCIVDKEQLDLFWLKYERFIETSSFHRKKDAKNWERFEFSDWLKAYISYRDIEK